MIWCDWPQFQLGPEGALERRGALEQPPRIKEEKQVNTDPGSSWESGKQVKLRFCDKYQISGHFQAFMAP